MSAPPEADPPAHAIVVRNGRLWVEGLAASALARRFGTPLYVVSEARLRENARTWSAALAAAWPWGSTAVLPSLKANPSLALCRILRAEGLGCDVFGANELELALRAGMPSQRISLNGATKSDELLALALQRGVRVTLDSLDELRRVAAIAERTGRRACVRLRLRPWLAASPARSDFVAEPYPAHLAVHDYRAGMPQDEARAAVSIACASDQWLDLAGIMAHVSRQTTDTSFWAALGSEMASLIADLRERSPSWHPREVDLGGGYATPRDPTARALASRRDAPGAPTPGAYLRAVTAPLADGLRAQRIDPAQVALQIEPGRAVYADAGIHLTTVRHIKRQREPVARTWIETDTSEAFLADTVIEHNAWTIVPAEATATGAGAAALEPAAAVTGISCGWDVLCEPAARAPVSPGDVLAFLDTGAYQDATASNFNAMGRPATVLVAGDDAEVIKTAETLEQLLARERVPERLR